MSNADYGQLINPPKEWPLKVVKTIDILSWVLPAVAAVLAVWGGVEAIHDANHCAAILSIAGGIASALGIIFTNWASRIRDSRLAQVRNTAAVAVDMASDPIIPSEDY